MPKVATQYLDIDPWLVRESGFHPERATVSESIFALGNEFMGVRGYFDEGYSGDTMIGSYVNGVFEEEDLVYPQYFKGFAKRTHFMVNSVDWLHTRIWLDGEQLDLAHVRSSDFVRTLDMRTGELTRSFVWTTRRGKRLRVAFGRFTSMAEPSLGCQRVTFTPLNFSGAVRVRTGLDFSIPHYERGRNLWRTCARRAEHDVYAIMSAVQRSGQRVFAAFQLHGVPPSRTRTVQGEQFIGAAFSLALHRNEPTSYEKLVTICAEKRAAVADTAVWSRGIKLAQRLGQLRYGIAFERHRAYWENVWRTLDITISGDDAAQQGIRFCLFHLHQSYHGVDPHLNITAKGLTGESYCGWTWWDTETYCLPFYLFNNPKAARNLLLYRYHTLPGALQRAREKDCCGARYPMGTIDGSEAVGTWQHGDLEIHVSAAVAYGIWHYVHVTGDRAFLRDYGMEMLLQICRYYASRGAWSPRTGEFGFWGVMGADEFKMMVHNNVYTNFMAQKAFEYTLHELAELQREAPEALARVLKKVALDPREPRDWRRMARRMRLNYDPTTGLFEQNDGFFDLPHVDVRRIPPTDFPLYKHWAYFRIFRCDIIKQPDVLLFLFLYNQQFSARVKRVNYEYYEPRCAHESSLSPSIHSILATELGKHADARKYFAHAIRLDLDDYNRNTNLGLHTTSMAGAWLNLVYGYGGLRTDGELLSFAPSLPPGWRAFSFRMLYRGSTLDVSVDRRGAAFYVTAGPPVTVRIYGKSRMIGKRKIAILLAGT